MKIIIISTLLLLFASLLFANDKFEIDSTKTYKIETIDGSSFFGKLKELDSNKIEITLLSNDKLTLTKDKIIKVNEVSDQTFVDGKYRFPNPNPHVYFLSSSAIPMKKGDAYYQNAYVFLNSFRVALTDNFNIGGGFEFISLFSGQDPLLWLTPKVDFEITKNLNASTSILFLKIPFSNNSVVGIWSLGGTYGNTDNNLNFGMGFGFTENQFEANPAFTLSGMTRLSTKLMFVSENWVVFDNDVLYMMFYAFRILGETMSFDIGFVFNHELQSVLPIGVPYINFIVKL